MSKLVVRCSLSVAVLNTVGRATRFAARRTPSGVLASTASGKGSTSSSASDWEKFNFHFETVVGGTRGCDSGEPLGKEACTALSSNLSGRWMNQNGIGERELAIDVEGCFYVLSAIGWRIWHQPANESKNGVVPRIRNTAKICSGVALDQTQFFTLAPKGSACVHPLSLTPGSCLLAGVQAIVNAGKGVSGYQFLIDGGFSSVFKSVPNGCTVLTSSTGQWKVYWRWSGGPATNTDYQAVCADAAITSVNVAEAVADAQLQLSGSSSVPRASANGSSEAAAASLAAMEVKGPCGFVSTKYCEDSQCRTCANRRRHAKMSTPYDACKWHRDALCCWSGSFCAQPQVR